MTSERKHTMLWYLHEVVHDEKTRDDADRDLLQRFIDSGDGTAFAALMRRHSGLVWSVCRRILHPEQDAEDAFQATFLLLSKKAHTIRTAESVGSWLYGVARRIALKARARAVKRRDRERRAATPAGEAAIVPDWELQSALDQEVERLPEKYRLPFVLCCLNGKCRREAARELGWKEGTLSTRVATARHLLRTRLARRGIAFAAALGTAQRDESMAATIPAGLERTTLRALLDNATGDASGLAPQSVSLAKGVVKTMLLTKLKAISFACLMLLVVGFGVGAMALRAPAESSGRAGPHSPSRKQQGGARDAIEKVRVKDARTAEVEKAVLTILASFEKADAKWKARVVGLAKLVKLGPASMPFLIDSLKACSPAKRAFAVEAITMFRDQRAEPAFRKMLKDPSPDVRAQAIRGLSLIGRLKSTEEPYRTMLAKDPSWHVRHALAWELERDDPAAAMAAVRKRLSAYNVSAIDTARLDGPAPDFSLTDTFGKRYRLRDFLGEKSVVLKFYNDPL